MKYIFLRVSRIYSALPYILLYQKLSFATNFRINLTLEF